MRALLLLLVSACELLVGWPPASAQPADALLINGKIITLDGASRIAEAIAIRGDRIVAVGTQATARAAASPAARTIDLGGRTVIPGLIDSHIHAIRAGHRGATEVSWIGATSVAEAIERLGAAALKTPPGNWIVVAGGWTPGQFSEGRRPTLEEVETAAGTHPVYVQLFYRGVLLSAIGTRRFGFEDEGQRTAKGFTLDKSDPGWLAGSSRAVTELYDRLPPPTLEQAMAGTRDFFRELNALGITGVIDPGGHNLKPEDYEAVHRLEREGKLTLRVVYSVSAPRAETAPTDYAEMLRFVRMQHGPGLLRFNGIGERVTWGMFNNDKPDEAEKNELEQVARWAAKRSLTLTAHWNNDRTVHLLLDIIERVDRDTPIRSLRWSIAHLHDASDASLGRMKALGMGWLMQNGLYFAAPGFIAANPSIARSPPIRTALRLGVPVGGGTDANRVMAHNPFVSLRWMTDGRSVQGLPTRNAAELVSREEALRLYTHGSAWFAFDENERGTLEPGKLADLAVLDRDYLTVPAAELPATRAVLTLVGGRIGHAGGPFAGIPR